MIIFSAPCGGKEKKVPTTYVEKKNIFFGRHYIFMKKKVLVKNALHIYEKKNIFDFVLHIFTTYLDPPPLDKTMIEHTP